MTSATATATTPSGLFVGWNKEFLSFIVRARINFPKQKAHHVAFQRRGGALNAKHSYDSQSGKIIGYRKQQGNATCKDTFVDCASLLQTLSKKRMPHLAQQLLLDMKSEDLLPDNSTLSALMLCYADNGLFPQAHAIWEELLNSSFVLSIQVVSDLMDAHGRMGLFNEIFKILDQVSCKNVKLLPEAYSKAISSFGRQGQLELMEDVLKEMISRGFFVDSSTGNAFVKYYSTFGSLTEMETAYGRLKSSRHVIDKEGIRAVSFAYLKERKFYKLEKYSVKL